MKDVIELIVTNIVTKPEEVAIEVAADGDTEVYTISVAPEDMGRVIGKNGKIIRSIRKIAHVIAIRHDKRFSVRVAETDEEMGEESPDQSDTIQEETPVPTQPETAAEVPEPATAPTSSTQEVTIMDSSNTGDTQTASDDETETPAQTGGEDLIVNALEIESEE